MLGAQLSTLRRLLVGPNSSDRARTQDSQHLQYGCANTASGCMHEDHVAFLYGADEPKQLVAGDPSLWDCRCLEAIRRKGSV